MTAQSNELWRWNAVDLARAIRAGRLSSREAVQASLARMAEVNPKLNAVVVDLGAEALAAADAADAAVARGEALGALHGVPITIKTNVDQIGQANSNGVVAFKDNIAAEDAPVVANIRKAGAVIIGRTNTPAFSSRWATENDLFGRTLNPWSPEHTPGGSSGGASASVAAGITPIGHANDLAGSVRYPAWCTGTVGLRPSFGRVPAFNPSAKVERALSLQWMSVQGPITRSVADARLALSVMAQGDHRDSWWVPAPLAGAPLRRPMRVALSRDPVKSGVHAHNAAALQRAADALAAAGYVIEELDPPEMAAIMEDWHILSRAEAPRMLEAVYAYGDDGIKRAMKWHMDDAPRPSAVDYMDALTRSATWLRKWNAFFDKTPLLLCPVSLAPPFKHGADVASRESFYEIVAAQAPCFAIPVLGLPAISVPTGLHDGLPTGVQLVGRRFREDVVLDAADIIEQHLGRITPIAPTF
ncbi:amidase [Bradyrhizobium sp. HKCCYLS3077]|uniref:amidase n=1 Tax=Bradyrhizobium sp. HKCCYLS3077 TaxID=3420761 RepID=UPI003EBAE14C